MIHPLTMHGWLGSGATTVKYLKRILCFGLTFGLAHISTFQFERRWIKLGKQLSRQWDRSPRSESRQPIARPELADAPLLSNA